MIPRGTRPLLEMRDELGTTELWQQLVVGEVEALHWDRTHGVMRPIERSEWLRHPKGLEWSWQRSDPTVSAATLLGAGNLSWLRSRAGMNGYSVGDDPVLVRIEPSKAASTAAAETKCLNWLESEMRANRDGTDKPKELWLKEAQSRFSGLSKRSFDRAWGQAIFASGANAWSRAGKKKITAPNHRI